MFLVLGTTLTKAQSEESTQDIRKTSMLKLNGNQNRDHKSSHFGSEHFSSAISMRRWEMIADLLSESPSLITEIIYFRKFELYVTTKNEKSSIRLLMYHFITIILDLFLCIFIFIKLKWYWICCFATDTLHLIWKLH